MATVKVGDAVLYTDFNDREHSALVIGVRGEAELLESATEPPVDLVLLKTDDQGNVSRELLDSGNWILGLEKLHTVTHGTHDKHGPEGVYKGCWHFANELESVLDVHAGRQLSNAPAPEQEPESTSGDAETEGGEEEPVGA